MKKIEQELEILLVDIPDEGLDVAATERDEWLAECLREAVGDCFTKDDTASLQLRFLRYEDNVNVDGDIEFSTHRDCDRCAKDFVKVHVVPLQSILVPKFASSRSRDEFDEGLDDDIIEGDLEFGTYEGDRIDVSDFVRSAVVLGMPMKVLCSESCKGLCHQCGANLNEGPCSCDKDSEPAVWSALKDIKFPKVAGEVVEKKASAVTTAKQAQNVVKKPLPVKKPSKIKAKAVKKTEKKVPKKANPIKKAPKKVAKKKAQKAKK